MSRGRGQGSGGSVECGEQHRVGLWLHPGPALGHDRPARQPLGLA